MNISKELRSRLEMQDCKQELAELNVSDYFYTNETVEHLNKKYIDKLIQECYNSNKPSR